MNAKILLPATALLFALGACSSQTENTTSAAANSAYNDAAVALDDAGNVADNAADSAKPALHDAGNSIDNAAAATGQALSNAGNTIGNATH